MCFTASFSFFCITLLEASQTWSTALQLLKKIKLNLLYYSCWFAALSTKKRISLEYSFLFLQFQIQMPKAFKYLYWMSIFYLICTPLASPAFIIFILCNIYNMQLGKTTCFLYMPLFFSSFHFSVSFYQVSKVTPCTYSEHTAYSSKGSHWNQKT